MGKAFFAKKYHRAKLIHQWTNKESEEMAGQATMKKFAFPTAFTILFLRLILTAAANGLFWLVRTINMQMAHPSKVHSTR
jgi:hypothetical protein